MRLTTKTDRGVAGLTILLSLVVMLFVIGLLVMIFALMGSKLQTATTETETVTGNTTLVVGGASISGEISASNTCGYTSWSPTVVINSTAGSSIASNETLTETTDYVVNANGSLSNITHFEYPVLISGMTYVWGGEACNVINATTVAIADVTDWFAIFIVIGAMVVLILLTVIIITAIRGSGMMVGTG